MVNQFDSPLTLGDPLIATGEFVWDTCYFAAVLILQDPAEEGANAAAGLGIGMPHLVENENGKRIWRLAVNGLPDMAPLRAASAKASALAVGTSNGQLESTAWNQDIVLTS
jgi:hypothetical protein